MIFAHFNDGNLVILAAEHVLGEIELCILAEGRELIDGEIFVYSVVWCQLSRYLKPSRWVSLILVGWKEALMCKKRQIDVQKSLSRMTEKAWRSSYVAAAKPKSTMSTIDLRTPETHTEIQLVCLVDVGLEVL